MKRHPQPILPKLNVVYSIISSPLPTPGVPSYLVTRNVRKAPHQGAGPLLHTQKCQTQQAPDRQEPKPAQISRSAAGKLTTLPHTTPSVELR